MVSPDDRAMNVRLGIDTRAGRLLTVRDLCVEMSIHRSTLYRILRSDASFPAPIYVAPGSPRWRREEYHGWLNSRRPTEILGVRPELLGGRKGPPRRRAT